MGSSRTGLRWSFEADTACIPRARRHVRESVVAAADDPALAWVTGWVDTAQLAVTEIVTNALVHAGTPIEVVLSIGPEAIRVDVIDGSPRVPRPRTAGGAAITGRGLSLVAEVASCWGVEERRPGKTVWFELHRESGDRVSAPAGMAHPHAPEEHEMSCAIVLRNVPLLLHAAWQEQAAAILRDYLLTSIEEDLEVLERHAAASTVLSLLAEQIPPPPIALDGRSGSIDFSRPEAATADQVVLRVPVTQVSAFAVMDRLLDAAIWSAQAGAFATPPVLAEVVAMRRWICAEVGRQSRGNGEILPWRLHDVPAEPNWSHELSWPSETVTAADDVAVAVSDDGFVLASSGAASSLLATRWPDGVVGRRFVSLVPPSHRQFVLAAFTYQLATERGLVREPLRLSDLGLRGRWESWSVSVEPVRSDSGRWVFVSRFRDSVR